MESHSTIRHMETSIQLTISQHYPGTRQTFFSEDEETIVTSYGNIIVPQSNEQHRGLTNTRLCICILADQGTTPAWL